MSTLRTAFTGAAMLLCAASAGAQEVRLHVFADSVTVGDRFAVSITAVHDFAADPAFPEPAPGDSLALGDLEVLQYRRFEGQAREGLRVDSAVYDVTTFALDTARVAPVPVVFTAGEDTFTVHTEATWIPVISLVPPDARDVRDLAPLVEFPSPIWRYVAAAVAAMLLIAALIFFYIRRRRREVRPAEPPPPPVPPAVEAYERLRALERADLSRAEAVKPFYVELSDALRTYLDRRLHVHALEQTTAELIRDLHGRRVPDDETTNRLRSVLTRADYVKFADARPPAEQGRSLVETARSIVDSVESALKPANEENAAPQPRSDRTSRIS